MKNFLTTWAAALLIALLVGASWQLDGPEDHQAEWDQSQALKDLQASEVGTARREAAAAKLCAEARGPNSEARWTAGGDLVCTTRRGLVAVQL